MTVVRITDNATSPEEVVEKLRKVANLIESLAEPDKDVTTRVVVTGDLNIEVRYDAVKPETEKSRLVQDIRRYLPYVAVGHPELAAQIEDAMKQVEAEDPS